MRLGPFRGLRFEILGNLAVVSLISLFLTGFGVWFINGRQLLHQHLEQVSLRVESFAEETLELLSVDAPGERVLIAEKREALDERMRRFRDKDPRMHLTVVDTGFRVVASTDDRASTSLDGHPALVAAFRTKEACTRLDGKASWVGSFQEATFAFPLQREGELLGGILATFSLEGVLAGARQTVRFILLYMTLGSLVFLLFGTLLISRTLVHPLEKTIRVMQRVADGDFQQKVDLAAENEMGLLAGTFNTMAEKLKAHELALNKHVKSLQKMNLELKETQHEVIQSEKLASVGLLAAGVAHEIGNPLGALLGYISMLDRSVLDREEEKDCLKRMENELLRIDGIVRDLLEYSKPSPRKVVPTDINGVIRDTVTMVEPQRDFRDIRFELRLDPSLPRVALDPGQLQQVFVNLFLNAKDAMGPTGTLRVVSRRARFALPEVNRTAGIARREDDPPGVDFRLLRKTSPARKWPFLEGHELVQIEVSDTGPGISKEDLSRVFDPFFTTKQTGRATGLGLSVSQRIIESFCGDIRIVSGPNESVRVRIQLPAAEDDGASLCPAREEMPNDGSTAAHRG